MSETLRPPVKEISGKPDQQVDLSDGELKVFLEQRAGLIQPLPDRMVKVVIFPPEVPPNSYVGRQKDWEVINLSKGPKEALYLINTKTGTKYAANVWIMHEERFDVLLKTAREQFAKRQPKTRLGRIVQATLRALGNQLRDAGERLTNETERAS